MTFARRPVAESAGLNHRLLRRLRVEPEKRAFRSRTLSAKRFTL
jgi:hypothetical protein